MLSVRCLLVLLLLSGFGATEDETIPEEVTALTDTSEVMTETSSPVTESVTESDFVDAALLPDTVDLSNIICNVCDCKENVLNCSNRDLTAPFQAEHWNSLKKGSTMDLSAVDLSGNKFVIMSQLPELPIKKLNLSNCDIEILEESIFSKLKYLTVVDLSRNQLSFVIEKRAFLGVSTEGMRLKPFMDLRHLSLAYNDVHSLSQDVFGFMPHLTFLDLSGNPLISIDQVSMGALSVLIRLKELHISECELETLPTGIFRRLRNLHRLDVSGNKFAAIPRALSEATNLLYLNLNRNPIEAISERTAISSLTKLQELHLSRNSKLRSIAQGVLGGLGSLIILHMSYNPRLTDLHHGFLEWEDELGVEKRPLLEEFYLNNNNISGIDSRLLLHWNHLVHVDFTANPYVCDCNNQWMINVLVPLIIGMGDNATTAKMICRKPYDYRGLKFSQLYEARKRLTCAEGEIVSDVSGMEVAVLYGVLVGMLVSFPIVMVIVILWKKGHFARCRKKMNSSKDYYDDEETDAF